MTDQSLLALSALNARFRRAVRPTALPDEAAMKDWAEMLLTGLGWQNRPLEPIYAVLLIDAIVINVRDAQVANRLVYVAVGVDLEGHRDVLGLWLGPTSGEGAKQWATMLGELKNRGLGDALIVCCDHHVINNLIGDLGDRLTRRVGVIDLFEMRLNLTNR